MARHKPTPDAVPLHRSLQYVYPFSTDGLGPLPEILVRPAGLACGAAQAAFDSIYTLDRLLVHYGHLLDLLQPGAPGKLAVRFLRTATRRDDERAPVLGAWYRPGERWVFRPLEDVSKALRARKKYGPFRSTYAEVGEVLSHVRELLRRRDALAGICRAAQRAMQLNAAQARAHAIEAEATWKEMLPIVRARRDQAIASWHDAAQAKALAEQLKYRPYSLEAQPEPSDSPPKGDPARPGGPRRKKA